MLFQSNHIQDIETTQFLWTFGLEPFFPLMGVNSSSLSLFLNAPPWCQAADLSEISRFLIARYVVNWKLLAAPYCIPLHVWARGGTVALCAAPLGRPIISLLPADTDLHMGRRTSASLCVSLWTSAQCVLDPTEGLWCCGKVNPCHFTFNAHAHRNLTFI